MSEQSTTQDDLAKAEIEVFGADAPRGPGGTPLELGHGSNYQKAHPAAKARYHALLTLQTHESEVASLASQLEAAKGRLATSRKAVADAKAHADAEAKTTATRRGEAEALTKQAGKDAETAQKTSLETTEKARTQAERDLANERQLAAERAAAEQPATTGL